MNKPKANQRDNRTQKKAKKKNHQALRSLDCFTALYFLTSRHIIVLPKNTQNKKKN